MNPCTPHAAALNPVGLRLAHDPRQTGLHRADERSAEYASSRSCSARPRTWSGASTPAAPDALLDFFPGRAACGVSIGFGGAPPNGCDVGAYEVAACADRRDNDGDGLIAFDGGATAGITPLASPGPSCGSALGNSEAPPPPPSGCGLGPELTPALLLLGIARRRSRSPN